MLSGLSFRTYILIIIIVSIKSQAKKTLVLYCVKCFFTSINFKHSCYFFASLESNDFPFLSLTFSFTFEFYFIKKHLKLLTYTYFILFSILNHFYHKAFYIFFFIIYPLLNYNLHSIGTSTCLIYFHIFHSYHICCWYKIITHNCI